MKISHLRLLMVAGVFLCAAQRLLADVTYYYNSLDSNPYDFTGALTLPSYYPGQPLPILTFSMSALVDGQTLHFTTADQAGGGAEALYDANPNDPLTLLYPYPTYNVINAMLGEQSLVLGPATPVAPNFGAPIIYDVPSYPVTVDASDNGVWLLTPPGPPASVPDTASTMGLFAPVMAALFGFARYHRRDRALSC